MLIQYSENIFLEKTEQTRHVFRFTGDTALEGELICRDNFGQVRILDGDEMVLQGGKLAVEVGLETSLLG